MVGMGCPLGELGGARTTTGCLQPLLQTALTHAGFTGFVPRARFLIGTGYPITTNRALLEFSQMTLRKGGRSGTEKGGAVLSSLGKTYPADGGLLPRYTGYVPGEHPNTHLPRARVSVLH